VRDRLPLPRRLDDVFGSEKVGSALDGLARIDGSQISNYAEIENIATAVHRLGSIIADTAAANQDEQPDPEQR
jgi:hypothetical protein